MLSNHSFLFKPCSMQKYFVFFNILLDVYFILFIILAIGAAWAAPLTAWLTACLTFYKKSKEWLSQAWNMILIGGRIKCKIIKLEIHHCNQLQVDWAGTSPMLRTLNFWLPYDWLFVYCNAFEVWLERKKARKEKKNREKKRKEDEKKKSKRKLKTWRSSFLRCLIFFFF